MKRVFVFEYLTGGGEVWAGDGGDGEAECPGPTLRQQALQMRDAMVRDLLDAPGWAVTVACAVNVPAPPAGAVRFELAAGLPAIAHLSHQASVHDLVWVVAPETGGLLLQCCRAVPRARWLGCDADVIALTTHKRPTLDRLAAHGLCTPLAFLNQAKRWVVKPDDGAGTVDTTVHDSADGAVAAMRRGWTREPWVEGEALSLSLHCRAGRAELLSINRQRMRLGTAGRLEYLGVDIDTVSRSDERGGVLAALAQQIVQALPGLRGFVGVDLVWHATHGPVVIEINPRLTCAYVGLSARLGRNLGAALLAERSPENADVTA